MAYQLPDYLKHLQLSALPVDYEWDNAIANDFWAAHDESSPRLAAAINPINGRAAFALGVACAEWVLARVEGHVDTSDASMRVQAAWASVADWRYASLPSPDDAVDGPIEFSHPLYLAMRLIARAHQMYSDGNVDVNSRAQALAMEAEHVAGRHPAFEPWLEESLRRCNQHYPDTGVAIEDQPPVAREFFNPEFTFREGIAEESLARFLASLDPDANPYLRSPADMLELGFKGAPYNRSV